MIIIGFQRSLYPIPAFFIIIISSSSLDLHVYRYNNNSTSNTIDAIFGHSERNKRCEFKQILVLHSFIHLLLLQLQFSFFFSGGGKFFFCLFGFSDCLQFWRFFRVCVLPVLFFINFYLFFFVIKMF